MILVDLLPLITPKQKLENVLQISCRSHPLSESSGSTPGDRHLPKGVKYLALAFTSYGTWKDCWIRHICTLSQQDITRHVNGEIKNRPCDRAIFICSLANEGLKDFGRQVHREQIVMEYEIPLAFSAKFQPNDSGGPDKFSTRSYLSRNHIELQRLGLHTIQWWTEYDTKGTRIIVLWSISKISLL